MSTEAAYRRIYNQVVRPPEHGVRDAAGDTHRRLHHLERPCGFDSATVRPPGPDLQRGVTFEVAPDRRVDTRRLATFEKFDVDTHSIRKGWHHQTMHHRPRPESPAVNAELLKPRPPSLELVSVLYRCPQLASRHLKIEEALVVDDWRRRHPFRLRASGGIDLPNGRGLGSRAQHRDSHRFVSGSVASRSRCRSCRFVDQRDTQCLVASRWMPSRRKLNPCRNWSGVV